MTSRLHSSRCVPASGGSLLLSRQSFISSSAPLYRAGDTGSENAVNSVQLTILRGRPSASVRNLLVRDFLVRRNTSTSHRYEVRRRLVRCGMFWSSLGHVLLHGLRSGRAGCSCTSHGRFVTHYAAEPPSSVILIVFRSGKGWPGLVFGRDQEAFLRGLRTCQDFSLSSQDIRRHDFPECSWRPHGKPA
jgi:hypothetical protein